PYVSPATTETKLETPSIVQGGDLRAVAKGLRYLGFGGVAGTVGTLAAILLDQFNPDTPGGYVWLLIGSQLVTAGTAVIGLILCIDSPSAARGRGLVAVALAINVAACFACVAVLGGIATSPLITILIVIASTVSTECCIIFSHRLATALDHPQLASRILLLMIGFLIWI